MADIDNFFDEVRELMDSVLDRFVPAEDAEPARLHAAIRWSLLGRGKRFRPALILASGREFGADDKRLVSTAAAVEMIHTYSLIHDDLPAMDDDDLRRGRATVHKKFDEATAILAGDALQAMAFEAVAGDSLLDDNLRLRLVSELAIATGRMVSGQQMDLEAEGMPLDIAAIEKIHKGKTGALIGFSVRAGGSIAGASESEMAALTNFGEKLGLLFQITDDLLDVIASTENLGKTAGKDAAADKATYPGTIGLDETKSLIQKVHAEAISELKAMDRSNGLLADLTDFLLRRVDNRR